MLPTRVDQDRHVRASQPANQPVHVWQNRMGEQVKNTVIVYSCVFGEETKKRYPNRLKRTGLDKDRSFPSVNGHFPLDSRELLGEVCSVSIPDVTFGIYQKNEPMQFDYEIQILIETCAINKIELSKLIEEDAQAEGNDDEGMEIDDEVSIPKAVELDLKQLKELLLPFKRAIHEELDLSSENTVPNLRTRCLIMPIKLSKTWTLVWVKFSKITKYLEMFQLSGSIAQDDRLSYRSQEFIKSLLVDLFGLQSDDELMFSYRYIPNNLNSGANENLAIVKLIQGIVKGYQQCGFNVSPSSLPALQLDEAKANLRHTRSLPLMELKDVRDYNSKNVRRAPKAVANTVAPGKNSELRRRGVAASTKIYCNTNSQDAPSYSSHSHTTSNGNGRGRPPSKKTRQLAAEEKPKISAPVSKSSNANSKVVVTLENLASIKKTIDYDEKRMSELVEAYVLTYNQVEAFLLDKWSRVNLFSKSEIPEAGLPFLIYGPSQIELEIIREGGIIATNTLKNKIKKYNVTLTTRTMRYLTSSRRWINQRFKLNRKIKSVYYTRDVNLIIPDYRDVPYIVMATHLAYNCLAPEETFEIIHKNWYISRKMVSFIIAECYKCRGKSSS